MATLLSIPLEIRMMIYYLLFAQLLEGEWQPADILSERKPPTQILRVCKSISAEATPIFWSIPLLVNNKLQRFMRRTGVPNGIVSVDHRWQLLKHVTIDVHHLNATRFREIKRMKQLKTLVIDLHQWTYNGSPTRINGPHGVAGHWVKAWRYGVHATYSIDRQLAKLMADNPDMMLVLKNEMDILGSDDSSLPGLMRHEIRWYIKRTSESAADEARNPPQLFDIDHFVCKGAIIRTDI